MRANLVLVLALAACKTKGTTTDDSVGTTPPTSDTVTTSATGDTSAPVTSTACWVPFESSECFDTTIDGCSLPTAAGTDNLVFLNQCTQSDYVLFDNAARIPPSTWVPGTPLPTI